MPETPDIPMCDCGRNPVIVMDIPTLGGYIYEKCDECLSDEYDAWVEASIR